MQRYSEDLGHLGNCWWKLNIARAYEIKEKVEGQERGRIYHSLESIDFIM